MPVRLAPFHPIMKKIFLLSTLAFLLLCGCASTAKFFAKTPEIPANAPIAAAGQDLKTAVAQATQAYVDAKNGDANFAWSVKQGLEAYQLYVKTKADVQLLVKQWGDGTAAGKTFAQKIADLFGLATGTPDQKAAAIAQGVEVGAAASAGP